MSTTTTTDLAVELASWKHPDGSYVLGDAVRVPCEHGPDKHRPAWHPSTRLETWLKIAADFRFPDGGTPAPTLYPVLKGWTFHWLGRHCWGEDATPIGAIQRALKKVKQREETT